MTVDVADEQLDAMYAALADPTRRGILATLTAGEATVTELAAPFEASLQSISQHVQVLERAGLISRRKYRQTRPCRLEPDALRHATEWIDQQRTLWEDRLDRLATHLDGLPPDDARPGAAGPTVGAATTGSGVDPPPDASSGAAGPTVGAATTGSGVDPPDVALAGRTVELRRLGRTELSRVGEIDRRERIDLLYDQHGTQLVARHGDWSAPAWDPDGHGEHSVEAQVRTLQHHVDHGGIAVGALASGRLVGIGVVVPHLRPRMAQLAFLHVSAPWRATGIGGRLSEQLEQIARTAGDVDMVVSATPSENTVRFYVGRGFQPMAEPLAELFDLEPEDVHLRKVL